jgi:hypothetical protein
MQKEEEEEEEMVVVADADADADADAHQKGKCTRASHADSKGPPAPLFAVECVRV